MTGQFFRAHGKFCASHPWEVIVAVITLTLCMMFKTADNLQPVNIEKGESGASDGGPVSSNGETCTGWSWRTDGSCGDANEEREFNAADMILMTVVRCSAILYCYYQFRSLHKFGSKYTLGKFCCVEEIMGEDQWNILTFRNWKTRRKRMPSILVSPVLLLVYHSKLR